MRDYLYLWHDPHQKFLVASGIEFRDFLQCLKLQGGIVLVDHQSEISSYDVSTSFDYVPISSLSELAAEDIYSWGNFVWADYSSSEFPAINDMEIASLLFLAHKARPLHAVQIHSLSNKFLAYVHDDGWYLRLYYSEWGHVEQLIAGLIPAGLGNLDVAELRDGTYGFWLNAGVVDREEKTHDVDSVLNRRFRSVKK